MRCTEVLIAKSVQLVTLMWRGTHEVNLLLSVEISKGLHKKMLNLPIQDIYIELFSVKKNVIS